MFRTQPLFSRFEGNSTLLLSVETECHPLGDAELRTGWNTGRAAILTP